MIEKPKPSSFPDEMISRQLERMLASADFQATPQQIALLKYVVNQSMAGNASYIKGYTVATEVFNRKADFDQSIDPIVSIQASRLRQALMMYYEVAGRNDPIRIDIPKGSYVPTFSENRPSDQPIGAEPAKPMHVMQTWPIVLIRPLTYLTANPDDDYLSIGLMAELAHALSHYQEIRVLEAHHRDQKSTPQDTDIDFTIDGSVRRDPESVRVAIRLCDTKQGVQIWSAKYHGDLEAAKMISFQEKIAEEVAVRVAGDNAVIARHLADLFRDKAAPSTTTYESMLQFWECDALHTPRCYVGAIQALEHAVGNEPECGQAWSMLASLYADNYGNEIVDLPTPLEKAAAYAQRGVSLDPTNRRARMILSYVRLMENKLSEARYEAKTAYSLYPDSLMVLDAIGFVMALAGRWERGVKWIKKAVELNPYYRPWALCVLCVNWFRIADYEKAYYETFNFMMSQFFWEPLMKAAICGHLGRIEEGQACVRDLLALKPDFAQRGRILIGRYIKFDDIADRIIEGLNAVGLTVK